MKAIVCFGEYAKSSYYFEKLGISVNCMEELCYCLKENACLLGKEIMDDRLIRFIDGECKVPQLAKELYSLAHQKGSLSAFVTLILEYVGFYDKESIRDVEETLKNNAGLTDYEKKKLRIDYLADKGKYLTALREYDILLEEMETAGGTLRNHAVKAQTLRNKGVILAMQFLYGDAAKCFEKAYGITGDKEILKSFLLANRMNLSEKEYIALIATMPEAYEISLQVEKELEALENKWLQSEEYAGLENMREWNDKGESQRYEQESEQLLESLKDAYREWV